MWAYNYTYPDELYHHGVMGMKWGQHRAISDVRSNYDSAKKNKKVASKEYNKAFNKVMSNPYSFTKEGNQKHKDLYDKAVAANKADLDYKSAKKAYNQTDEHKNNVKKAAIAGAAVAGTALAAYGTYKLVKVMQNKKALELGQKAAEEAVRKSVAENRMLHELANEMMKTSTSGHVVDSLGRTVAKWG